jgi:EAL and modified HD-GYP domain-containing signal transduction protein
MNVAAYELRSHYLDNAQGTDHSIARTIFGMFTEPGLDLIVGEHVGIITLRPEALAQGLWKSVPKGRVVFRFPDAFGPADPIAAQLCELSKKGYRLALPAHLSAESLSLLNDPAHTIRLNVTKYLPDELEKRVTELRKFKPKLVAEGVDTYDDLEFCKALEFDFFQGHFLCKPSSQKQTVPVNRVTMLRLLSRLQDSEIEIPEVEKMVSQDVTLSYRLLRYANSASVALPRSVSSIGHAVRLIGLEMLKTWASALLLSTVEDKPRELMTIALVRARMCELLSHSIPKAQGDAFLSAGLLSVLDALLDCSMEKAVGELPLAHDIKSALVSGTGQIGQALRCTIAYEQANWDDVQFYGLAAGPIREKYLEAIAWSRRLSAGLLN